MKREESEVVARIYFLFHTYLNIFFEIPLSYTLTKLALLMVSTTCGRLIITSRLYSFLNDWPEMKTKHAQRTQNAVNCSS